MFLSLFDTFACSIQHTQVSYDNNKIPTYSKIVYPCATRNCKGNATHKGCNEGSGGPLCEPIPPSTVRRVVYMTINARVSQVEFAHPGTIYGVRQKSARPAAKSKTLVSRSFSKSLKTAAHTRTRARTHIYIHVQGGHL